MIADEAAVFQTESTAKSSTGVMKLTPSSDNKNRSKACSVIHIGCNEIPVALATGITIPAKSSAIGTTRIRINRIYAHTWKIVRSHNTPKKVHVDDKFVFEKNSKFAGILLRNKSSREITIAKDSEIAKVLDEEKSTRTKQCGVARSHMLSKASKSKLASSKAAPTLSPYGLQPKMSVPTPKGNGGQQYNLASRADPTTLRLMLFDMRD